MHACTTLLNNSDTGTICSRTAPCGKLQYVSPPHTPSHLCQRWSLTAMISHEQHVWARMAPPYFVGCNVASKPLFATDRRVARSSSLPVFCKAIKQLTSCKPCEFHFVHSKSVALQTKACLPYMCWLPSMCRVHFANKPSMCRVLVSNKQTHVCLHVSCALRKKTNPCLPSMRRARCCSSCCTFADCLTVLMGR